MEKQRNALQEVEGDVHLLRPVHYLSGVWFGVDILVVQYKRRK